jgi:hypothetical protein
MASVLRVRPSPHSEVGIPEIQLGGFLSHTCLISALGRAHIECWEMGLGFLAFDLCLRKWVRCRLLNGHLTLLNHLFIFHRLITLKYAEVIQVDADDSVASIYRTR